MNINKKEHKYITTKKYVNKKGEEVIYTYNPTQYMQKYKEQHGLAQEVLCPICGWTYKKYSEYNHTKCKHHLLACEIMKEKFNSSSSSDEEPKTINIIEEINTLKRNKKRIDQIIKHQEKLKRESDEIYKYNGNLFIKLDYK